MLLCLIVTTGIGEQLYAQESDSLKVELPTVWDLQTCIDYALKQNLTIRKNRITAESSNIDVKTAQAALFPNLSFSTGQNMVNRPYQEKSNTISGTEILTTNSKTSYNGNYGLNASWTIYNGSKRLKTIEQEKLNSRVAELDVTTSENSIEEGIAELYMQILYAAESVRTDENTLELSQAELNRGKELLAAGSISRSDLAQLEAQVSNEKYQLVTAETTLQNYKLQLKQLLELEGSEEMNLYLPTLSDERVLTPLPEKMRVYQTALTLRPEIAAGKLNVESSSLNINIAKAAYLPTLSMSAGIGTNNTSGGDFTFGQQVKNGWNNSVGLSLSIPIFNNRQAKSAVGKAKLQFQSSQLTLLEEQKALFKTIETLWLDANSAQLRFEAAKESFQSTQTSYDLISEQFRLGMKNTVELLTAKNTLLSAQQEMLQSKYMALLNAQLLSFYKGEKIRF